ncbi:hypothetical protein QYE76_057483 [Lolium multiflorum]|uniref:Reverse transcriptase domain-containing protein n=1 Tax=Lolium multiflorum TaxID=4521 RepID=A0AAD8WNU5_LOLMU|nr:hypothetical protein QYE76_057483 [Lolium multiflorum]
MCAALSKALAPFWAGYGGGQQGFMCCEVPPEELQQPTANSATVIIEQGRLTEEEVEAEFKDLVDENWDWQVRQLSHSDFAVVFPSKESLRIAIRGGGLTLPSSKVKGLITVQVGDPLASETLVETWVRLIGVPPPLRHADRLLLCTRELGRPIGVDVQSLEHPSAPIRMSVGCIAPVKIQEYITVFVNMQGYRIRVEREDDLRRDSPPLAPPPAEDKRGEEDKDEDNEETNEDRWDGRRGRHLKNDKEPTSAPVGGAGGAGHRGAPTRSVFSQYGSNLTKDGDIFPMVAKIMNSAVAQPQPQTPPSSFDSDTQQASLSIIYTPEDPMEADQCEPTPGKALRMSQEDRDAAGLGSPSPLASKEQLLRDSKKRSKNNHNRPSRRLMLEMAQAADTTVVDQNSPAGTVDLHRAPAIVRNTSVRQLLLEDSPIPELGATVARAPRSKAVPAHTERKSARGKGISDGPVLERAVRIAADKNDMAKSVASKTATTSSSSQILVFDRKGRRTLLKDYLRLHRIDVVLLQETIKHDFTDAELRSLEVGENFFWAWLPANGHSGGMLIAVRDSVFEVGSIDKGQFYISVVVLHRATNRTMDFIGIYGPADHGRSSLFLQEISDKIAATPRLLIMGGDFNLIRAAEDKNNSNLNWPLMDLFNANIAAWALREIPRTGARFTWTNRQLNPVRSALDRVFVSPSFEALFPLCSLSAETSLGSDHTPLVFDTGEGLPVRSNRFFFEASWCCGLAPETWAEHQRVTSEENNGLALTFSEAELESLVNDMKSNTAPGPDGLPVICFKSFWPLVKREILHILNDFVLGRIYIARLNFGILSLIPKVPGADQITQYRPIALINVIFKIVSKAYASRMDPVANRIISPHQTAFIKGRNILDGPLALIEIIHEIKTKKLGGILLKLGFEKAYDRTRGPLSPLLFNFIGEALSAILSAAGRAGHIHGVVLHLIPGGVSHLQYADDTLILIQNSDEDIANLKFLLMCFEDMSGLKINYHKSEVIVMGQSARDQNHSANKLNCKLGAFPFIYLGLPISDRKLSLEQWLFLVRKLAVKVEPWLGKLMSSGGRLILSNACLDNLPMYAMGLFLLHDGIHARFDTHRSKFFWEGAGPKRKYHMVNWPTVCRPKELGGFGLLNTKIMNQALLLKWVWRLYQQEDTIWVHLIRAKYRDATDIFSGNGHGGSQFWKSFHRVKHLFKVGAKHLVRDGHRTNFWLDWWIESRPLMELFPHLFAICEDDRVSVATALQGEGLAIRFRRSLDQERTRQWRSLCILVENVTLVHGMDQIRWHLDSSGLFSVKSLFFKLSQGTSVAHFKDMWESRVPLKIKIFSWQLALDKLPSNLQIATRHGPSTGGCALCGAPEDATHIFFSCSLAQFAWAVLRQLLGCNWRQASFPQFHAILSDFAGYSRRIPWALFLAQSWALWTIRNKLSIEKKVINHPADFIYKTVIFLQLWRPKFKGLEREGLCWMERELRELYVSMKPRS